MRRFKPTFYQVTLALVLILLAVQISTGLVHYAQLARPALAFPYPLDYGEGPLLDQTLRLCAGETIYSTSFSAPPYTISNYPPLFLLLQVPFCKAFGAGFWYGRLISLISAVLAALFITLTLHTLTGDWIGAAVGGLLLVVFPYVQFWSLLNRIDLLALAFSWAALLVLVRGADRSWGIPAAAILLVAAIYTRQSYALAMPLAAFAWLLCERRFRPALQLALLTGGTVLVFFLALNLLTQGGFYQNIVTANVNPFYWGTVRYYFRQLFGYGFYILLLVVYFLIQVGFGIPSANRPWLLAAVYLLGATGSALTVGKEGSNVNYMLELAAALSFATGAALAWSRRSPWTAILVVLLLVIQVGELNRWTRDDMDHRLTSKFQARAGLDELFRLTRSAGGPVLADEYMGLIPLAGQRLYFQPFEYKQLADVGIWDSSPLQRKIRSQDFALILWYDPPDWDSINARWTPGLQNAVRGAYQLETTIADVQVYRKKP